MNKRLKDLIDIAGDNKELSNKIRDWIGNNIIDLHSRITVPPDHMWLSKEDPDQFEDIVHAHKSANKRRMADIIAKCHEGEEREIKDKYGTAYKLDACIILPEGKSKKEIEEMLVEVNNP